MNNKMLVLMFVGLMTSNVLFAQDANPASPEAKPEVKQEPRQMERPVAESETPAAHKMRMEAQKQIDALEEVDRVFIQLTLQEPTVKQDSKAVVLVQGKDNKINDEVINKIKTIVSTNVEGLDSKNVTVVEMDLNRLRRDMGMMGRPGFGRGKPGERPEMGGHRGGQRGGFMKRFGRQGKPESEKAPVAEEKQAPSEAAK